MNCFSIDTIIGKLTIGYEGNTVTSIGRDSDSDMHCCTADDPTFARQVVRELEEYFSGQRKEFGFGIRMHGSTFQTKVWNELLKIPYGSTATYGEIATRIGTPNASRAVGMACNRNPLLIVVPCHRVVGHNGKLTGYAAGIRNKDILLNLEKEGYKKE